MNKLKFNTQTDKNWSDEIMTFCDLHNWEGKIWTDYLGRWGCLITSIANIIQYFTCKKFTPHDMNSLCIALKAYNFLTDHNCKESEASNLNWDILKKYIKKTFDIKLNLSTKDFKKSFSKMYIARIIHDKTKSGHFINVLSKINNNFWCFDVENGKIKSYNEDQISFLHEFKFNQGV